MYFDNSNLVWFIVTSVTDSFSTDSDERKKAQEFCHPNILWVKPIIITATIVSIILSNNLDK